MTKQPAYQVGQRVEAQAYSFDKPGTPREWYPGTVERAEPIGDPAKGRFDLMVRLDDGRRVPHIIGPRSGGKAVRTLDESEQPGTGTPAGGMRATISTGPKGRTTTVTLPDGTTATRTSKTRDYTHAVVVTEDNYAHAAKVQRLVDRRRAYVEALEAWIARGSNMSELKAYPSASLSYAEQQAGVSKTEYYLPGFEPVKQTIRGSRYSGGGGSYWSDPHQFSLPNPDNNRRTKFHDDQGEGLTDWERYGPQHALKKQRDFIEHEQAQADKLRAKPQFDYGVWRWSGDAGNAQSYANQINTGGRGTARVVSVEGATGRVAEGEGAGAGFDLDATAAKVRAGMSADEARALVDGLRAPQVRQLAESLGALAARRAQLDYLKQRIIAHAIEALPTSG
jgi:hypothetical protein